MLLFCPSCSNVLTISRISHAGPDEVESDPDAGKHRFECRTCPYQYKLLSPFFERKELPRKRVEDILGGSDSWENVDKTTVKCKEDSCDSKEAYFTQAQTRSADEPMTTFYKCTKCSREWREN